MTHHVFGIRHHGPGCARSLVAALEALAPDCVLVEGPPDADEVLPLAASESMEPPVALLVHPPGAPERAAFYPFAVFSPEWQAIRFALARGVPVRFMDLPHAISAALPVEEKQDDAPAIDAIGLLSDAAGYTDRELWWEQEVERRREAVGLFDAIRDAMTAVRAEAPPPVPHEARREAHMRQTIRAAVKEGRERIAVVCGAWHAPALATLGPAKPDAELLKGLPKTKVAATWIPWTHSRLSYRSGYGAGVASPGWYHHVWTTQDRAGIRWATQAARLLRDEDLPASSAGVIETVRLADTLASLRDLRAPGLAELGDAILAVLCGGNTAPLALVRQRLEIGESLGRVPPETPSVPLARDVAAKQKSLRLKVSAEAKLLDLDLRNDTDRERSRLFHRLNVLGVPWAAPREVGGKSGTFHEFWEVLWRPELEVALVEASVWGNDVESAAGARAKRRADECDDLADLTALLDSVLLAELASAVEHVLARVQDQAAVAADVRRLMDALPPLARAARYGDVRGAPTARVAAAFDGIFRRALVGLPNACGALDDDAAASMAESIRGVQRALDLLERAEDLVAWHAALTALESRGGVHGLVRGTCCRLLLEKKAIEPADLERRAGLALSPGAQVADAAAWLEGLLRGSGAVLLHLDGVWRSLDAWLAALSEDTFVQALPLVRRAFSNFEPAERRRMGDVVLRLGAAPASRASELAAGEAIDERRADLVLPVLARILGVDIDARG